MLPVKGLHEVVHIRELLVFVKFECFPVHLTHVFCEEGTLDVTLQRSQLVVVLPLVIGDDRDGVVQLVGVRIGSVVH
jgi:hypothetical protein